MDFIIETLQKYQGVKYNQKYKSERTEDEKFSSEVEQYEKSSNF
ncbi:hypothetical protein KGMB01110_23660 [Mediterraneibacter butyricigenes]|uniref:Uncharacterized protein n=1 Tax=Mediterraneibacter butyricigenes TaxID=2316025 RepID=A0A391P3X4_9FIRM|nr:hypothetical protein KGMB01110_23660 [Mediterraneibacter butyricigenes]